jgi:hypothetical protein
MLGTVSANGGKVSGDGGLVRIGASGNVAAADVSANAGTGSGGRIQLSAVAGAIGTGSLDVSGGFDGGSILATSASGMSLGDVDASGATGNGGGLLATSDGRIVVTGDIDARGGVNGGTVALSGDATATPTYAAIQFDGIINASGGTGNGGAVSLQAIGGILGYAGISVDGGHDGGVIGLSAQGDISVSHLYARGDSAQGGDIDVSGVAVSIGYAYAIGGIDGGTITLAATGDLYANSLYAMGVAGDGGTIDASGDGIVLTYADVEGGASGGAITFNAGAGGVDVRGLYANGGSANGGTIGVASVGASGVFFALRASKISALNKVCPDYKCPSRAQQADIDAGKLDTTLANVTLAVGIAALAGGVVLVLTSGPSSEPSVALAPSYGGAQLLGRF